MRPTRFLLALVLLFASSTVLFGQQPLFAPAPQSPIAVGRRPVDVAAGDMNRDGKPDLLTANTDDNSVTVLLGDGRGGFRHAPASPFDAGPKPHLLALGDFNNDRNLDAAVTEHDSNDVRVFLGHGDGRFVAAPHSPFRALSSLPPHNHGLGVGDVNGDGKLDLTTSNQNDSSVSVLLGDGSGRFAAAPGSPFRVGRDPYNHALGDLNGDGALDIVTPNVRGGSISVLLGNGHGGFAPATASPYSVAQRPFYTALADLDRDGHLDLAITHDDITSITILLGDGRGGFRPAAGSPVDAGHRGWKIALGDVNRDNKLDLVTGAAGNLVVVLLGDGEGGFARAPGSPIPVGRGPWSITLADVNGDGRLDILTANSESNNLTILLAR